jgi:hypothetical protein
MRPLSASELLETWERGVDQHPVQRALLLLEAACPDLSPQDLARLSLAERDARLLELRERTFGSRLASLAACPVCAARLDAGLLAQDLRASLAAPTAADYLVSASGYRIRFRLPNSQDLLAILPSRDAAAARRTILERCLLSFDRGPESAVESGDNPDEAFPPAVLEAVAHGLEALGDQADLQLNLTCSACGHTWEASLDFPAFFWAEITAWARRLLVEIHTLAAVYGWREADILALAPGRRQIYLELIRA